MIRFLFTAFLLAASISGCRVIPVRPEPIVTQETLPSVPTTTKTAEKFDIEKPLRCNVNWIEQDIITTIPYKDVIFKLERITKSDPLPRYEITGFTFKDMPAEKVISKLLSEANIKVIALDGPYNRLSARNLKGELEKTIKMISESSEIYYTYDAKSKRLILRRKESWRLHMPSSKIVILAILDALRGSDIKDIITDWEDKTLLFKGGYGIEKKVRNLIKYFDEEPNLLAYDVDVYRVYPVNYSKEIVWQDILKEFPEDTVKVSLRGVLGRLLITGSEMNSATLRKFLRSRAAVKQISQGTFIVPTRWQSRFDIGRCGSQEIAEAGLSILVKSSIKERRLESDITFDLPRGELTRFSTKSRLGENFLVIGIPTEAFGTTRKNAEIVVLLSPRVIRIIKSTEYIKQSEKSLF